MSEGGLPECKTINSSLLFFVLFSLLPDRSHFHTLFHTSNTLNHTAPPHSFQSPEPSPSWVFKRVRFMDMHTAHNLANYHCDHLTYPLVVSLVLFKDPENISSELICLLCGLVFHQPYQVMCAQGTVVPVHLVQTSLLNVHKLGFRSLDHVFCKQCLERYIDQKGRPRSKNKAREPHPHHGHGLFPEYSSSPITKIITMTCPQCEQEQQPLELLDIITFRPAKFIEVRAHRVTAYLIIKSY